MTLTELARVLSDIEWVKLQLETSAEISDILRDKLAELEAHAARLGCPQQNSESCYGLPPDCGCGSK